MTITTAYTTNTKLFLDVRQIAKNAKEMRVKNGLTITHMAKRVGLAFSTIRRIESATSSSGARHYVPSYRTLFKLARAARVDLETFTSKQLLYKQV